METRKIANVNDGKAHDVEPAFYLDQNWTAAEREGFYHTPQGSHIIPLKFALGLETKSGGAFFSSANLARYGFIQQRKDPATNPYGMPVGFTVDGQMKFSKLRQHSVENGERMLGINCAACHTGSLHYQGRALRIDGGQGMIDFQSFVKDMDYALRDTKENPDKLDRFFKRVAAVDPTKASPAALLAQLETTLKERGDWTNLNHNGVKYGHGFNETSFSYGPGRNDAFAIIFNQVLARDLGVPGNAREPNAPVSLPVIWDAPYHDWVQWNGLASNNAEQGGPMARNLGQVLGVFGRISFKRPTRILDGYCSTARRENLEKLEEHVKKLWSPQWPTSVFGQLDQSKVARGKVLFEKSCVRCHDPINRMDPNRSIQARLVPMSTVGTDTKFNDNAINRMADTSPIAGKLTRLLQGREMEAQEPAATALRYGVAGAIAGTISIATCSDNIDVTGGDVITSWGRVAKKAITGQGVTQDDDNPDKAVRTAALVKKLSVYKARPLNGLWSSPPFLHNGSVNSIYDLLLSPSERKSFYVGCDEYDPVKLGLACSGDRGGRLLDISLSGNTPVGHDYGPKGDSAEADRWDLIEYLKSL
jgi:hypothetical protein